LARKDKSVGATGAYSSALFEIVLITVVAPTVAIFSCLLITSLKWAPSLGAQWPHFSPKLAVVVFSVFTFGIGKALFNRHFKSYREELELRLEFSSETDRRAVFWQKTAVLATCGLVMPLLACLLTFWVL
jgi:hypothetical protein